MKSGVLAALLTVTASAQSASAQSTAVFTYDVKTAEWPAQPEGNAQKLFESWAGRCASIPGGGLILLDCPPPAVYDPDLQTVETRLALFRDLDETIHFAGCPDLKELERLQRRADAVRRSSPPQAEQILADRAKSMELCSEVEPGQTFSADIEGDKLLALTRGRQLAFTLFRSEPKPRQISTPYVPEPSKGGLPHVGPATQRALGAEPVQDPEWDPIRIKPPLAEAKPAKTSQRAPEPAKTSLRTVIVELSCSSGEARIYVDETPLGLAPLRIPLIAGPHSVEARRDGRLLGAAKIEAKNGESLKRDICRSR